jgi:hypothetical protein
VYDPKLRVEEGVSGRGGKKKKKKRQQAPLGCTTGCSRTGQRSGLRYMAEEKSEQDTTARSLEEKAPLTLDQRRSYEGPGICPGDSANLTAI